MPSQLLTSVLWVLPSCPFSVSPYLPPRTMSQRPPSYRDHPCSRCSPSLPPAHCPGYSVTIASGTAVNTCQRRHSTSATCLTIMTLSPPPSQSSVLHCCCPHSSVSALIPAVFCEPVQHSPPCRCHATILVTSPAPPVPSPTSSSPPRHFSPSPPPNGGGGGSSAELNQAVFGDCCADQPSSQTRRNPQNKGLLLLSCQKPVSHTRKEKQSPHGAPYTR